MGCANAQKVSTRKNTFSTNKQESLTDEKILIVYLSRTKNTKAIAEIIHSNVGGELVELELEKPYPKNYKAVVDQVAKENETGFLPPLKTKINGIENYDVVFVGFPTWGMQLPPPMKSFLRQYDLGGKTVIPFNTHAGYGVGSGFETVKGLCPNCKVLEGFSTKGGVERDGIYFVIEGDKEKQVQIEVKKWLQKLNFSMPQETKNHTNSLGMEFISIPAGEFLMGASENDREAYSSEKPQHKVSIGKPFFIGKYEAIDDLSRQAIAQTRRLWMTLQCQQLKVETTGKT